MSFLGFSQDSEQTVTYVKLHEDIAPSATRLITKTLQAASENNSELVIIDMDTYGGLLLDADSIRIQLLNSEIPVYVFINKNAGSAGALISIACDKIFMAPGATIGSATVVGESGEVLPDKYQSYMRSIMRSTAESHGSDTTISNGDTLIQFKRNPQIAEAMVDERVEIEGLISNDRVLAFTTSEAITNGYCEGEVSSLQEILSLENKSAATLVEVTKSGLDKVIGFLAKPALQGVLLMFIFWGIFFELRSPGIGFALAVALIAALLYFAPLYLDGLAQNWEILLFVVGIVLIGLEIFVIPGFGVAGITGILCTVGGLLLSMIRNVNFDFSQSTEVELGNALTIILIALVGFIIGAILFGRGMTNSPLFRKLILTETLEGAKAGHSLMEPAVSLLGHQGLAHTDIRPFGKALINGEIMDVKSMSSFIDKGSSIKVIGRELGYWIVE